MIGRYIRSKSSLFLTVATLLVPVLVLFWEIVAGRVLFWGTPLMQFIPWVRTALDTVRAGEFPLWNPLVGNGAPLLANYQSAVFYPPNWLHLLLPPAHAASWLMVLHVLWAGVGMWFFTRGIGLRSFSRLVSALGFMLSGYLVSRLGFFSIGSALPWLPWLFWAAGRLVDRRAFSEGLVLGICLGMQWLSGHAQTSFYSGLALGVYLLWRVLLPVGFPVGRGQLRQVFRVASILLLAAATGLGLAAIQLLPTAELQQISQRAVGPGYDFAMTYSLWPLRLIAFLSPRFFGHPATGNYWGYCCNFWEDNGYVGFLPLLLAIGSVIGWVRGRIAQRRAPRQPEDKDRPEAVINSLVPFFALLSTVGLILAFGVHTPVYPFLFEHVPGFGLFQAPARLLVWWTFGVSILAGIGAEMWRPTRRVKRGARYGIVVGLSLLLAAAGATRVLGGKTLTFVPGLLQMGLALVLVGVLALQQPHPTDERLDLRWSSIVLLFVAIDLVSANWGANPTAEPWLYTRPTASAAALRDAGLGGRTYYPSADEYSVTYACPDQTSEQAREAGERRCDRFLSFESFGPSFTGFWYGMREAMLPNTAILDGIPSANNLDPLVPARYQQLVDAVDQAPIQDRLRLLRLMGVETLITEETVPGLPPVHVTDDVVFSAVPDPFPRAYLVFSARPADSSREALELITDPGTDLTQMVVLEGVDLDIQSTAPSIAGSVALTATVNTVTIRAALPQDGFLVLLDTYYPGWQALVDDRPAIIHPANLAFRAVELSAGEHRVDFRYRPASMQVGAVVTGLTCFMLIFLMMVRIVTNRRRG